MNRRLLHEFKSDMKIDVNSCRKDYKSIGSFSPIPNVDLQLNFQAWYEVISPTDEKSSLSVFRLKLEKLYGLHLKPSLEFDVQVTVKYNTTYSNLPWHAPTCTLNSYKTVSCIVEEMDCIHFGNVVHKMYDGSDKSTHNKNMHSNLLVLVCRMKFYINGPVSEMFRQETHNTSTYLDDFEYFFQSDVLSDVVFQIGERSIPAHKVILAAHSPVFRSMLTHDFLESKTNCIKITDFCYEIFEHFLKYLYYRKIEDTSYAIVTELHVLSDKYDVSSLKEECAQILTLYMNDTNICDILKSAYDFNNEHLKIPATVFARVNFDVLKSRFDWKDLIESHPLIGYEVAKRFFPKS